MEQVLLDSNIIIALAQGKLDHAALDGYELFVSDISRLEVLGYHKISPGELSVLEAFFRHVKSFPIDEEVMNVSISLRRQNNMSVGDAIIAATCRNFQLTLLTANTKDFVHIESLQVLNPIDH
jgi:predicted nucleic acid-binding protein